MIAVPTNRFSIVMRILSLLIALASPSFAATLNFGSLATTYGGPPTASVNQYIDAVVDLSDLTGLTPGNPIEITFSSPDMAVWVGRFSANIGILTIDCRARLDITAGAYSTQSLETWGFGPIMLTEDISMDGNIAGYINSPAAPASFTLTVPWGTDLSEVTLTLTDLSSITAVNGVFSSSAVALSNASLTTTSSPVPEPSAAILVALAAIPSLRRKR